MRLMTIWFTRGIRIAISALILLPALAVAGQISFDGLITQATSDGTGPAVNNLSLNNILDGDAYSVVLTFSGAVSLPGTYSLSGASLLFSDPAAPASESAFGTLSLTLSPDGAYADISLLGCLTTGSGCLFGNQLAVNFKVPAASLNSSNVPAQEIFGLNPSLDLLEDDGVTDIQGSVVDYSGSSVAGGSPVPEPSSGLLAASFLGVMAAWKWTRKQNGHRARSAARAGSIRRRRKHGTP